MPSRLLPAWPAAGREPGDQVVQRGGQDDRAAAEAEEDAAVLVLDVPGGQGGDDAELLGVEQDEEAGDPVGGRVGLLVEEPRASARRRSWSSGPDGPAQRVAGAVRLGGVLAGDRPADEVR